MVGSAEIREMVEERERGQFEGCCLNLSEVKRVEREAEKPQSRIVNEIEEHCKRRIYKKREKERLMSASE